MRAYPVFLLLNGIGSAAGSASYTLNLVYQVQVVGLDPLQIVLVGTLMEIVCFIAQVPTGVIADLYSRKLSLVIGYGMMGVGILVVGAVPTFTAVLIGHAIWGIGAVCIDGAQEAWAADEIGEERIGRAFARGSQVAQVGGVIGTFAAVALALISLATPILVASLITMGLAGFLAVAMPENNFTRPVLPGAGGGSRLRRHGSAMRDQLATGAGQVRRSRQLGLLLGAGLFLGLSSEGIDRLSQPHFLAELTFPSSPTPAVWFGAFAIVSMLGTIGLTEIFRRRIDELDTHALSSWLAALQAAAVATLLVFAMTHLFWLAVGAFLLLSLLRAAAGPLLAACLVRATSSATRATVFSLQGQVDAAGQIAGGPPIGLIGSRYSTGAALAAAGLLMIPAALCYLAASGGRQRSPARLGLGSRNQHNN